MARPRKNLFETTSADTLAGELVKRAERVNLEDMPLEKPDDYRAYNEEARRQKKQVKFIPDDMFPKTKVRFVRMDGQAGNPLHVRWRDAKTLIDFDRTLKDGEEVELPNVVIDYLNNKKIPKYKQVKYPDGSAETVLSHYDHRFTCQMVL